MRRRHWPRALLAAAIGLVVAVVPAGSATSPTDGPAHVALSVGHPTEALLVVEHPRALGQLPPAVTAAPASGPAGRTRWALPEQRHTPVAAAVVPPAAIRGPPA